MPQLVIEDRGNSPGVPLAELSPGEVVRSVRTGVLYLVVGTGAMNDRFTLVKLPDGFDVPVGADARFTRVAAKLVVEG